MVKTLNQRAKKRNSISSAQSFNGDKDIRAHSTMCSLIKCEILTREEKKRFLKSKKRKLAVN